MKLNLRRKHKKRLPARVKEPLLQPIYPNVSWSMDFMEDTLSNGNRFRVFNVIDDFNREALNITLGTSITSKRVIRELEKLIEWRGIPQRLRVDNGPEFIARALQQWCDDEKQKIDLKYIQKGKPSQNGYVERFNRTFREDVLDEYSFEFLADAQAFSSAWIWMYNNERPHKSLGYITPSAFLLKHGKRIQHLNGDPFPTFQKDQHFDWKNLVLNVSV